MLPFYLGKKYKYIVLPYDLDKIKELNEFYIYIDCYFERQDKAEGLNRYDMRNLLKNLKKQCYVKNILEVLTVRMDFIMSDVIHQ